MLIGRAVWVAMLMAAAAIAQPVVVADRVNASNGRPGTGTIAITASKAFEATDGVQVTTQTVTVPVVSGRFSVPLEPNVTGTLYQAVIQLDNAKPQVDWWAVPAGTSPVNLRVVRGTAVTVGYQVGPMLRFGTGAPADGAWLDGDFYLRTDTMCMYGPKAAGSWPTGCSQLLSFDATGLTTNANYCMHFDGTRLTPTTTGCPGTLGTLALTWSTITSGAWAGLTSGEWATLAP